MIRLKQLLLTGVITMILTASGHALAFMESFSFGDSFGDKFNVGDGGWSTPDWGVSNTWGNPPRYRGYPPPYWGNQQPYYGSPPPYWGPPPNWGNQQPRYGNPPPYRGYPPPY